MADIRKRTNSNGTISYQVRYISKATKSGYAYRSFATAKEARAFREDSRQRGTGCLRQTGIRTVEQAIDRWFDICVTEGTENHEPITRFTQKTYQYRAAIMKRYSWPVSLQELRPSHVLEFKGWLLRHCAGRHQAMKVLSSFHSVLREMFLRDVIAANVASGITIPMDARHRKEIVPPTEKELFALLAAADRLANKKDQRIAKHWQRYRPILYLAADTGPRPQEYLALAAHNVTDTEIKIDRAIERGGYSITSTKTAAGRRWIDISPDVRDMVVHYMEHHAAPNAYNLVFPGENGRWQCPGHWRKRGFYKACEEAGLMVEDVADGETVYRPKYSPYDLRHFYASMLIEQGTNLKRIQKLLGHEDIKTTLNHYGHLIYRAEASKNQTTGLLQNMAVKSCGEDVAHAH